MPTLSVLTFLKKDAKKNHNLQADKQVKIILFYMRMGFRKVMNR